MNLNKKMIYYSLLVIMGLSIVLLNIFFGNKDSFLNGIGTGITSIGVIKLFNILKYKNDEIYAKKINIQNKDERNIFLDNKAKTIAFNCYIIICGILVIVLKFLGFDYESLIFAYTICGILILYFGIYFLIRKKY